MEYRPTQIGTRLLFLVATIAIVLDCYISRDKGVRFTSIAVAVIFGLAAIKDSYPVGLVGRFKQLIAAIFLGVLFVKHFL
ncbi:hypothetical protein GTP41_25410 [Pseudoduganella sp. DS3]|uniref:Uncharacterized protein n=1 Tax=Pseudoduganella guangdongensis TaxID=2692179 RepID=A0A6N9HQ50_9BURK|nr:hypothetical protein [Pseudoduganella guangdongensis]MYN05437.1 hypothetical protein [Pseudoduganella guangdongensis]